MTTATSYATNMAVQANPTAPVVGQPVTLTATVSVQSLGTGVPTGTVTFEEGSTILGTPQLNNGVAEVSFTPSAAGLETISVSYGGNPNDQAKSVEFPLTVGQGTATLSLSNLSFTYDGLPHAAVAASSPIGLSGLSVTYSQTGVTPPTRAGTYTVTASLINPNYMAAPVTGTLVIGQAMPAITWATPANITAGTALSAAQLDATARFDGVSVPGVFTYNQPIGAILPQGNGQTLSVSFAPTDGTDFKAVSDSVLINVVPPSALIISEQPVFQRKLNKRGKPVGKAVLTGFTLEFSMPLNAAAASNASNYQLDALTTKIVKKKPERVAQPVTSFKVSYTPATDSVTLELETARTFPAGGEIEVLPGVTSGSESVLAGATLFTISPGAKTVKPS